jgi:hypothetical protein
MILELCQADRISRPSGSKETWVGWFSRTWVATPLGASPSSPVPITVWITPPVMVRTRWLFQSRM